MKLSYRPEIDGLRTIAVFGVIFYHANFFALGHNLFQGGFIGVDIFFVISGYLISGLIFKEIYLTNSFSFKNFYERRIRRIIPVLFFVIVLTSIISFFVLFPKSIVDFSKSILSSIFFGSNIYFNYTGNSYGDEHTLFKPLVHTWSLAVEEQFYILFPIFIFIIYKILRNFFLKTLFVGFFLSIILSAYLSVNHPGTNFYQLPSRIFEIILGSLIAYFDFILKNRNDSSKLSLSNQIFPKVGLLLILYSFFYFRLEKIYHPSFITLIPLIGVSLIIWFSKKGEIVTEILSSKIFVFFGLISYSLYLWHYPIFSNLRYLEIFNPSDNIKILAIVLTIALSIFSYYFIERPFRNKKVTSRKILTIYILFTSIFLISYSLLIIKNNGLPKRFSNIIGDQFSKDPETTINPHFFPDVILIGDSHAGTIRYNLKKELNILGYNLKRLSTQYYLIDFKRIFKKTGKIDDGFIKQNKKITDFLEKNENQIVVIFNRWSYLLSETRFDNGEGFTEFQKEDNRYIEDHLEPINVKTKNIIERQKYLKKGIISSLNSIIKNNHKLIIVYPVPEMGFDVPKLMNRKIITNNLINNFKNRREFKATILSGKYEIFQKRNMLIYEILDNLKSDNIYRVYPEKIFCNSKLKNRCVANEGEHLFYSDDDHLSLEGSRLVNKKILKIIKQIENNSM
mgnify:CR=1 FL=1|tara:strand:- start:907 stop:2946 length:2040 start_codon:yes stop_codon:yes gene_type:complete